MERPNLEPWERDVRLPRSVKPQHYDIFLHPVLQNGTFSGNVTIDVQVSSLTPFFAVHIKDLNIIETRVERGNKSVSLRDAFFSAKNSFWVIRFPDGSPLEAGSAKVFISFSGKLTGKIVGFYRSNYKDSSGNQRLVFYSDFPCDILNKHCR